ncbi:hypothetical protein Pcinc_007351 [Petrolisthes cinctipes]|uniref:Uncharacterized protein n=1 Tax=Petrolisthes cinctipes TaxID=88211 RepID=A0AAE1GB16_PETCI|nr:hypothetical protein Pcinc_007351 [Petrolisthes cinctipes]
MGHCAAPDAYTKRFDDALVDVQRKFQCIDDTLLHNESVEAAFWHAYEMSTDGGTNLVSDEMVEFFKRWGLRSRSPTVPQHAPERGEQISSPACHWSPAKRQATASSKELFTREDGGNIPEPGTTARSNYRVDRHWQQALHHREVTMAQSRGEVEERQGPARTLTAGTKVWVQNQTSGVWDRSGVIVEVRPHRQYTVRLDGSGRVSLRNRRHLRVRKSSPSLAQDGAQPATPTPAPPPNLIPSPPCSQPPPTCPQRMTQCPRYLADYIVPSPPLVAQCISVLVCEIATYKDIYY